MGRGLEDCIWSNIFSCLLRRYSASVDIVLTVDTPTNMEPSEIINRLRDAVANVSSALEITDDLTLSNWTLSTGENLMSGDRAPRQISGAVLILFSNGSPINTVAPISFPACPQNSTGGPECQCEDSFTWSCDICDTFGACSNASPFTCDCINGIPPSGKFCQPISSKCSSCECNETSFKRRRALLVSIHPFSQAFKFYKLLLDDEQKRFHLTSCPKPAEVGPSLSATPGTVGTVEC